jgi:hypothetical protein
MKDSAERLEMFMQEEYIDNPHMGAPDMRIAIQDILTDLFHIGGKYNINIPYVVIDAEEAFAKETL